MELRQLRYFAEVASVGSYVGAAKRVHIAEPSLWKQVHLLERELDVQLFEPQGRRVRLTSAGTRLLEHVRALLRSEERLRETAQELRQENASSVTVGCLGPHVARYLGAVVERVQCSHPHFKVRLHEYELSQANHWIDSEGNLIQLVDLMGGDIDLLTWWPRDADVEGFVAYLVRIVAVLPPGDPRAESGVVSLTDLRDEWLLFTLHGDLRDLIVSACRAAGFEPRVASQDVSPLTRVALSHLGLGIPLIADDALPLAGKVVGTPVATARGVLTYPICLYWRRGAMLSPAARAFIDAARAYSTAHEGTTGLSIAASAWIPPKTSFLPS